MRDGGVTENMSDLWPSMARQETVGSDTLDRWFSEMDGVGSQPDGRDDDTVSRCPECNTDVTVETVGHDVLCLRCGTVLDTPLEEGAEYRWFSSESTGPDPSRCGFPVNALLPESSYGTIIIHKRPSISRQRRAMTHNHIWSIMPSRERTLWKIFEGLQVRTSNAGISTSILEEAKLLFAQVTATAPARGETQRNSLLAACVWEALRRHDSSRMPNDVAAMFAVPPKAMIVGIRHLQQMLSHRSVGGETGTYTVPGLAPTDAPKDESLRSSIAQQRKQIGQRTRMQVVSYDSFITPFITNLSVPRRFATNLEAATRLICKRVEERGVVPENTPPSLAASVLLFCSRHMDPPYPLDVTEIARVCHVSAVTLQKCVKRLEAAKEKLLIE